MTAAVDVVGIGYNTEDHVWVMDGPTPAGGKARASGYFVQPGGQVPTALVALQRWGMSTAYIGPIGDDAGGARQLASLRAEGVVTDGCVRRQSVPSHLSFITVDASSGERTIQWYRDNRLALRPGEIAIDVLAGARALLLDGDDIELAIEMGTAARRAGVVVMLDVDRIRHRTPALMAASDIAIVPAEFAHPFGDGDPSAALRAICDGGPRIAVVTQGARGAVARADGREYRQPAFAVEAVDTTSAGDVFHAAFLYDFLHGGGIESALRFAAAAGALATATMGGRDSIPALDEVCELTR